MRLQGKVALITGGTSGIGRATARLFCKEGAKVVVVGRTVKSGEETVEAIKKEGGEVTYISADVSKASDVEAMVREAVKKYGRIDILFNNAGTHIAKRTPFEETDENDWDRVMDVNFKSVFLVTKYTVPVMKKQGGGTIISTSSTFAIVGSSGDIAYSCTKGAILLFTKSLALELGKYNIRVNCVNPGTAVDVRPEGYFLYDRPYSKESYQERSKLFPLGRLGTTQDIANAVLFLASDESSFVTGTPLIVDGGFTAQ
ncbi:MAG: SDR family oxidoreductase [Candidatus Bathyarchaeota archaeon]